jgi:hypothetical protein
MLRKIVLIFLSFLLVSCGPIYRTDYEYSPPSSSQGRVCANNCLLAKQYCESRIRQCNNQCLDNEQTCRMSENLVNATMSLLKKNDPNKKNVKSDYSSNCVNQRYSCERNCQEDCTSNYNICHQNCGGKVLTHRKCEMFCEEN